MITITDVSNWKLKIQRTETGITILQAITCDHRAVLPGSLFGLPVTALGDYGLSSSAGNGGEEVLVRGTPPEYSVWSNARLQELTLPDTLETVGNCAFLGCWELRTLHLWDNIRFWGSCVLTSCRSLHDIDLQCSHEELGVSVSYLVQEVSQELDVTLHQPHRTIRLMFPDYVETEEESFISQAVQFAYRVYGAGFPYHHHCFVKETLNLRKYDTLWKELLRTDYDPECALQLAWWRLRYPAELGSWAAEGYLDYLRAHTQEAVFWLLTRKDTDGLKFLLDQTKSDRETLSDACEMARSSGSAEALAILLEEKHRRFTVGPDKDFDL